MKIIPLLIIGILLAPAHLWGQTALEQALNEADSYLTFRDNRSALEKYDSIVQTNPQSQRAIAGRGKARYYLKQYEKAIEDFSTILMLNDKDSEMYLFRGRARQKLGDNIQACQDWKKALDLGNQNANTFIQNNCTENATNTKNETDNIAKNDSLSTHRLQGGTRGSDNIKSENTADNNKILKEAAPEAVLSAKDLSLEKCKIGFEQFQAKNVEAAEIAFEEALKLYPTQEFAFLGRAEIRILRNDLDNALLDLDKALLFDSTIIEAHLWRGRLLMQKGQFTEALPSLKKARELQIATAYSYCGITQAQLAQWQEALQNFSQAIALNDQQVSDFTTKTDYYHRAQVYMQLKQYTEARNDFLRHAVLFPNDSLAFVQVAETFFQEHEVKKACFFWIKYRQVSPEIEELIAENCTCTHINTQKKVEIFQKNPNAEVNPNTEYTEVIDCLSCFEEAKKQINQAKPANALMWLSQLAYCNSQDNLNTPSRTTNQLNVAYYSSIAYFDLNKFDLALENLNYYINLVPTNPEAYYHRALVHKEKGNAAQACQDFKTALSLGFAEAKRFIDELCK